MNICCQDSSWSSVLLRRCRCTRTTWPKCASSSLSSAATSSPCSLSTRDHSPTRSTYITVNSSSSQTVSKSQMVITGSQEPSQPLPCLLAIAGLQFFYLCAFTFLLLETLVSPFPTPLCNRQLPLFSFIPNLSPCVTHPLLETVLLHLIKFHPNPLYTDCGHSPPSQSRTEKHPTLQLILCRWSCTSWWTASSFPSLSPPPSSLPLGANHHHHHQIIIKSSSNRHHHHHAQSSSKVLAAGVVHSSDPPSFPTHSPPTAWKVIVLSSS